MEAVKQHTSEEAVNRADGEEKGLLHKLELEVNVDEPVSTWRERMSGYVTIEITPSRLAIPVNENSSHLRRNVGLHARDVVAIHSEDVLGGRKREAKSGCALQSPAARSSKRAGDRHGC